MELLGAPQDIIFILARRMDQTEKFDLKEFLIHTLELKLWYFENFPYVCIGKPCICNVLRPRVTWWAWPGARISVTTITRLAQNCTMGACLHCVALQCM